MTAELVLRGVGWELDLLGWNAGPYGDFLIETLADGTEWGNPEPVRRKLRRFLLDGSTSVKDYDDNRTIPLSLRVTAADGNALAGGEAALDQVDGRRCELVWTPPDLFSAPAVFVVDFADLRHKMDDLAEVQRIERFYSLTLNCEPHAYSDEWVEVPALSSDISTPTVVDTCSSLSGWSTDVGALVLAGGVSTSISSDIPAGTPSGYVHFTRTGTIDLSTEPYLRITTPTVVAVISRLEVEAAGSWHTVSQVAAEGLTSVYDATAFSSISALRIQFAYAPGYSQSVDAIATSATPRTVASRQQIRSISVPGSRRTPATVTVESPTAGLSTVIVYSGPAYDPSLSRGAQESRTTSAGTLSGAFTSANHFPGDPVDPRHFRVRASELLDGQYVLWARSRSDAAGSLAIIARLLDASGALLASVPLGTTATAASASLDMHPLLAMSVPWNLPPDSDHLIEFRLEWSTADAGMMHIFVLDEMWAFNISEGDLSIVEAGAAKKVWLTAPSLESDSPGVYVGDGEFRSAFPASLATQLPAWAGASKVQPPTTYLFTGVLGAADAEVSALFRPAHHTHPTS